MLKTPFEGNHWRLADSWFSKVPLEEFQDKPIKYLEIGAYHGGNVISVANTYASHIESELHCIDPWEDYEDYWEYKNQQESNFQKFSKNIENSGCKDKIKVHKGYSNTEILKFPDNYFDIIYVDGNHETEYVCEDGVLSFRKLKPKGYMIFDDYIWGDGRVGIGVDAFRKAYFRKIKDLGLYNCQYFVQKL
jgi:hypothetical protein